MENYIFTFEDGEHYVSNKYTETDVDCVQDGTLTIIRSSDCRQLDVNGETWAELPKWEN